MLAQYLDLTDLFNSNDGYVEFEMSNYDYAVVQPIGSNGDIQVFATLDSGAVTGVTDGSIYGSDNYVLISLLYLNDYKYYDTMAAGTKLFRIDVSGRYIRIGEPGTSRSVSKLLVMLTKIS